MGRSANFAGGQRKPYVDTPFLHLSCAGLEYFEQTIAMPKAANVFIASQSVTLLKIAPHRLKCQHLKLYNCIS